MRRTLLSVAVTAAGVCTLLALKPHQQAVPPALGSGAGGAGAGAPASGTYTGDTVDTRYGPVQVRITIEGGRLTRATAVRTPSENARDRETAGYAVPVLTSEALAAQSARIDTVSGATYTSEGYIRSLQSALDQAHG
ncbi:FMN-binding domain-containing protein [Streptomyces laurentii]|uniref:FMN-binding domain-containing protein n=1 Tax=Streptomyces laurentii TaxID=39478 RepID=A0A160P827_STRLU|nr:FMN-binding domain-containing protein [Streptomyces laurentii]